MNCRAFNLHQTGVGWKSVAELPPSLRALDPSGVAFAAEVGRLQALAGLVVTQRLDAATLAALRRFPPPRPPPPAVARPTARKPPGARSGG